MKRWLFLALFIMSVNARAANLLEVYQEALVSDPTFQQAIAQQLATSEGVPISLANLLPNASALLQPFLARIQSSGPAAAFIGDDRQRGYQFTLTATQTIFNYAQIMNLAQAQSLSKQAVATLNAASQDLMIRVSRAYFKILEDQDNLLSTESTKTAYSKQLDQINQQYKVGLKTITDVYTAQASYDGSVADYIAAMNTLANDRENLRVITGKLYTHLSKLSESFPFVTPKPANINTWVDVATKQNWSIKAAQYGADAARQNIKQQFAGHLPTLNVQGSYNINYTFDFGSAPIDFLNLPGASNVHTSMVQLNLGIPLVQGGQVIALTRQAQDQYRVNVEVLEQTLRNTLNITRQSYLGVIAGISKIKADKQAIISSKSSVQGLEAGYRVGTQTLVNVLNQQQQVYINEKIYAHDRYQYIDDLLTLKEQAGTLSVEDLFTINSWLITDTKNYLPTLTQFQEQQKLEEKSLSN